MKHLLKLSDLSTDEILQLLALADKLKAERRAGVNQQHYLPGKTLGMIFQKASTRTRVSFEAGMYQLGGSAFFLSSNDLQIGRGEPIQDSARVLSRFLDGIMIRTYAQSEVEDFAKYGSIPVINGLTDYAHPCQVLADLQTIREYKGSLSGLKLSFIGDGNNMANSLIVGGIQCGMTVAVGCPEGYEPDAGIVAWGRRTGKLLVTSDIETAAKDADVVYTDVWASMGQESDAEKRKIAFAGYCVNNQLMSITNHAMVQHCLPAHRGEEITEEVLESHADEIFDQAENRLHAQKAVVVTFLS